MIFTYYVCCGFESNVYIVKMGNTQYIMKRYPIIDSNLKNFKMTVSKEIDMGQFINYLPETKNIFFMKTIDYKLVKCKEIFEQYNIAPTKTNKCIEIIYEYKGKTIENLKKISLKENKGILLLVSEKVNYSKKKIGVVKY